MSKASLFQLLQNNVSMIKKETLLPHNSFMIRKVPLCLNIVTNRISMMLKAILFLRCLEERSLRTQKLRKRGLKRDFPPCFMIKKGS
jgi:hypothetical protein